MSSREPTPEEYARVQSEESEISEAQGQAQAAAQGQAQAAAQGQQRGPIADFREDGHELLDRMTAPDLDSAEYEDLEALIKPFLSKSQMLAAHGEDYYDDLSHELLNENLVERVLAVYGRPRHLSGPFLDVALDVEHDGAGPRREPLSPMQQEALRAALVDVRTDRQSLGDGTFFEGVTEIHVSSEVSRENGEASRGGKGLLSTINPFS